MSKHDLTLNDYKKFFEDTPIAFIRTDIKTGEFLMANHYAAQMFGYDNVDDLITNSKISDAYPVEERKKLIQKIRKNGSVYGYELKLVFPNRTLWVSAHLHINCGGTCIEGSLIDITDYMRVNKCELENLQKVSDQLDSKIAAYAN